jgi:hypothetical protein
MTQPVGVRGGPAMAADTAQLRHLAGRFGDAATHSLTSTLRLHAVLVDPDLAASGLLDPIGFAAFEGALLDALDGPGGLSRAAARSGLLDADLRLAAAAYAGGEERASSWVNALRGGVDLPKALLAGSRALVRTHDPLAAAQVAATSDPALTDAVVDQVHLADLDRAAAALLPDGHGVATRATPLTDPVAATPPRDLRDVLADLDERDDDDHAGTIDVRILSGATGGRRVIVDVSGTKSWSPAPTSDVTSLVTNARALLGEPTAYEQGVLAAMTAAGVRPTDDVMLVGHSQGGMVAVTAARDAVADGRFHVTHVVTAGSPIARSVGSLPSSIRVLALENSADLVPHLDGLDNPARPNVVTASSRHGDGGILDDHGVRHGYLGLADDVTAGDDPALRDYLASCRGWFDAAEVHTTSYQIVRRY